MITIFHNPRCKKSRNGLQHLTSKNVDFKIVDYTKTPLSIEILNDVFAKLNRKPSEMIRKQEALFKSDFKSKVFTEDEWIRIFVEHPNLIHRPIIVKDFKAIWADPIENIDELIK